MQLQCLPLIGTSASKTRHQPLTDAWFSSLQQACYHVTACWLVEHKPCMSFASLHNMGIRLTWPQGAAHSTAQRASHCWPTGATSAAPVAGQLGHQLLPTVAGTLPLTTDCTCCCHAICRHAAAAAVACCVSCSWCQPFDLVQYSCQQVAACLCTSCQCIASNLIHRRL
jgi:hypothetical protein